MTTITRQDVEPVELDPPNPATARWEELADRDVFIHHGGDAEKVMPFPRPAWSDPDEDIIGRHLARCYYASAWVDIPLKYRSGEVQGGFIEPATIRIRAKWCGDGDQLVGLSMRQTVSGKWQCWPGTGLTAAEATALAEALLAAVDLIGGPESDEGANAEPVADAGSVWFGSAPQFDAKVSRSEANYIDAARKFIDSAEFYLGGVVDEMPDDRRVRTQDVIDRLGVAMADLDRIREAGR